MVVASLSCTISVQETTVSSWKHSVQRSSLAAPKGHRRSLDVTTHVLATQVTSPDAHGDRQTSAGLCVDGTSHAHWTPGWTKALQTKFSAVWDRWQKLSTQISQYKALRPDWVGQTQELLDQQFQRFLSGVGAAGTARPASTAAARPLRAAANFVASRAVTLTPYLTVADEVEVSFAAMLADLCNMAYEVDKLDPELIEARHRLSVIATSITCGGTCQTAAEMAVAFDAGSHSDGPQEQRHTLARSTARLATVLTHEHAQSAAPRVVSFTMGGSPSLSPSISMLQLTSPEAVTAALTSQGHGAAFAHPVYVSTSHHALISMGSYDEEADISDLELRAAMAAGGPRALIGVGSLGTIGTMDEISTSMMRQQFEGDGGDGVGVAALASITAGMQDMQATTEQAAMGEQEPVTSASAAGATMDAAPGRASIASGILFSDASLSEDRDFVAGYFYGYKTPLVERRRSSDGGLAEDAVSQAAVTQSGAAGGRALREEQNMRRRSSSGSALGSEGFTMDASGVDGLQGEMSSVPGGPPVVVACTKAPPSAWFACDDKLTKTRYFAIQGSTSLEHWQINLQFEPVVFEDPKYGVRIHRGVYEAAQVLYDDLLPLVQQHLETSPHATVSFAGHSLGGSLGTVLMLLFVLRGVLKPSNISPVYTFGAPAVFCQGAVADAPHDRCAKCTLNCEMRTAAAGGEQHSCSHDAHHAGSTAASASRPADGPLAGIAATAASMDRVQAIPLGLMATLGLSDDQVVNVIMHKDIVPRAFVCDYTAVAGVLQRWWPSFRDHHTLQDDVGPHKSLYNFVGRVAVLRPSPDLPFVNGPADAAHPMLPNHPALYRVGLHDEALPSMDQAAASLASWDELFVGLSAMATGCRRNNAAAAARRAAKLEGMQKSVAQFMNQPHPLTTLSDYQAYGPQGFVSRYHNPDNYTRALSALVGR